MKNGLSVLESRSVNGLFTTTLLVLNVGRKLVKTNLLGDTFSPFSVLGSTVVLENGVDLLEGKTLELREDKPGVEESGNTEAHEDDVSSVPDVVEHDGSDLGNGEV